MNQQKVTSDNLQILTKENESVTKALAELDELRSQVVGIPGCGRANCFGRGYTGFTILRYADGSMKADLKYCSCAQGTESEYTRLRKHFDASLINLGIALETKMKESQSKLQSGIYDSTAENNFVSLHHREFTWKIAHALELSRAWIIKLFTRKKSDVIK
jgi:hypothetical protein